MKLPSWRRTSILAFIAAALIAAACGSPSPEGDEFVFTPVPYTVVPTEPGEPTVVIALDKDGNEYLEGSVLVLVSRRELEGFTEWLDDIGLEWRRLDEDHEELGARPALISVRVPLGAAPAAREFIRDRPGVEAVDLNHLASGG